MGSRSPRLVRLQWRNRSTQFVNDDLEPEFVGLMHHDEEQFVRGVVGEGNLQLEQVIYP